jgi:hypothetical protein
VFQPKPSSIDAAAPVRAPSTPFSHSGRSSSIAQRNLKIVERGRAAQKRLTAERSNTGAREDSLIEKILQAFNTWSFKREQPDNLVSLREAIGRAVHRKEPIPFVLYWGKGPRRHAGKPEIASMDYLGAFADRIRGVYRAGASIQLICTDTHANLNGHSPQAIKDYFGSIRMQAQTHGFTDCRLTDLVRVWQNADNAEGVDTPDPDPATLQRLSECAAKWYRGEGSASEGASEYFRMNMVEKRAVELAFITFNGSEFRCLFPDRMPIFYMYSVKRGVSAKPWFLPDEMP